MISFWGAWLEIFKDLHISLHSPEVLFCMATVWQVHKALLAIQVIDNAGN